MSRTAWPTGLLLLFLMNGCVSDTRPRSAEPSSTSDLDFALIEEITGLAGQAGEGEYKLSVPQDDLHVTVDGFRIIPPMGLTSWVVFAATPRGAVVMGDLVVLEGEISPVQEELVENRLTVTALHNHFVRDAPKVMFMHIGGVGPLEEVAQSVRAVLDRIQELRRAAGARRTPSTVETTFDSSQIEAILGSGGQISSGVFKVTIGRPDVDLRAHGVLVSPFMGFNSWMAFQGSQEKAAVAGDFALLEHEVAPVVEALIENGIEVVAVHNHMTLEQPRVLFLHFWGVGPVERLAGGLRAGLDRTGR